MTSLKLNDPFWSREQQEKLETFSRKNNLKFYDIYDFKNWRVPT